MQWSLCRKILNGPWLSDVAKGLVGKSWWTQARIWALAFGWGFLMDPGLVNLMEFWLEIWWWGAREIQWGFSWAVRKAFSLGPSDGSWVRLYVDWVIWSGWLAAECLVISKPWFPDHFIETPALKDEICCWVYHKSQRVPPPYGHYGPVWDPFDVHGHGYARVERVRSDIFWCKSKSGCSDPNGLSPK